MTTSDCPRTSLVEALRDGRLGPQENASMERHLEGCAVCAACARDLAKIGDAVRVPREKLTPLEHQRARVALLQKAASLAPAQNPSPVPALAFALVCAAVAMLIGFGWGYSTTTRNEVAIAMHLGVLPSLKTPRFNLGFGAKDANGDPKPQMFKLGFHPSDDARFTRNRTNNLDELTLDHGTVEVKLPKLEDGKRFVVRTKDAQIEVHATAFRVEAEEGKIRSIAVEQGTVEVQYAGFTAVIPTGGSWRATTNSVAPPPSNPTPDVVAPATTTLDTPRPTAPPVVVATNAPRRATSHVATQEMAHSDKQNPAPEIIETTPPLPEPSPAPSMDSDTKRPAPSAASQTFAEAMNALRRGDYAGSAKKLEQFSQTHAADARADEADYLRAIALQRAGKHDDARAAAKRYLATRPNGAHRANASRIAASQ